MTFGSSFSTRTFLALACVVGAVAFGLAAPAFAEGAAAPRILIVGSSSVNGSLGSRVHEELSNLGYDVVRHGKSSSGFARPDFFDWEEELPRLKQLDKTDAVLVYAGVNDGQSIWLRPDERKGTKKDDKWVFFNADDWEPKYEERVHTFVQKLCDSGVKRVVVMTPMDVTNKKLQSRLGRVREIQAKAARKSTCGRAVTTSGDEDTLRGAEARGILRLKDGSHATIKGAKRIWDRVERDLLSFLPPAPSGR
jgi:hypothetical protein